MPNITTDNFYLDGGIVQEFLPGNIINANLQGYSTFFNKNMPTSFVNDSLNWFQQTTPQNKYPQDKVEVIENAQGQASDATPTEADKSFSQRLLDLFNTPTGELFGIYPKGTGSVVGKALDISETKAASPVCDGLGGGTLTAICNTSVEGSKRIGLVIAGLLLLALGIWSLR